MHVGRLLQLCNRSFRKFHLILPTTPVTTAKMHTALLDLAELEAMAGTFGDAQPDDVSEADDIAETARQWQTLFDLDHDSAVAAITNFRADINRTRLSDVQWSIMAHSAGEGHNKESYEYELEMQKRRKRLVVPRATVSERRVNSNLRWMIGPLPPQILRHVKTFLPYDTEIQVVQGKGEDTTGDFIIGDPNTTSFIKDYLSKHASHIPVTCTKIDIAAKQLDSASHYPTLGLDTTLPQFRPDRFEEEIDEILQNDYPVQYFFYGTLAEPGRLVRMLDLPFVPHLEKASVTGGKLKEWKGASGAGYKALVNGDEEDIVNGHAFEVQNEEQEMVLRKYETSRYEVVRCMIGMEDGRRVKGLTFRFRDRDELS